MEQVLIQAQAVSINLICEAQINDYQKECTEETHCIDITFLTLHTPWIGLSDKTSCNMAAFSRGNNKNKSNTDVGHVRLLKTAEKDSSCLPQTGICRLWQGQKKRFPDDWIDLVLKPRVYKKTTTYKGFFYQISRRSCFQKSRNEDTDSILLKHLNRSF